MESYTTTNRAGTPSREPDGDIAIHWIILRNHLQNTVNQMICWREGGRTGAQRSPFPMNGMSLFLREEGGWFRPEL